MIWLSVFSIEVLTKLKPIQVNIKGGGPSNENNQGGGMKIRKYGNFPISEVTVRIANDYSVILQIS